MFIVTLEDKPEALYSIFGEKDERVIPLFLEHDDAERYLLMLDEAEDYPEMQVIEMEDHVIIKACHDRGQSFTVITPDDLLIPPDDRE
tara:strand:+ start:2375 stop:2638 length:264 start_codon:yes stop_codon:yes gene_type:complete